MSRSNKYTAVDSQRPVASPTRNIALALIDPAVKTRNRPIGFTGIAWACSYFSAD